MGTEGKGRILLVDDYELNRDALSRRLERSGYLVSEAEHGQQALDMLQGEAFDLVLLDINMPGIDGLGVLKVLRGRYTMADLPVVMLTSKDESEIVVEAFRLGANDYVTKPIDFAVTLARIQALLARKGLVVPPAATPQPDPVDPEEDTMMVLDNADARSASLGSSDATHDELPAGTVMGNYTIRRVIGRGGMSVVYEAESASLARKTALKVLSGAVAWESWATSRFRREARAAARVEHPNVVGIYDIGTWNGSFFIAMQLIEGESAKELLGRRGRLPWPEPPRLMIGACRGVAAAHARGVLHRDIKPDNILLSRDGTVKVTDFGIAKLAGAPPEDLTQAGQLLGTPRFMSPEQCRGSLVDARSDIYQMGATYYTLLTGLLPYHRIANAFDIMVAHCDEPSPDPAADCPDLPEKCRAIVLKALQKRPEDRYSSADEFMAALEATGAAE